ncbi:hypothetical protein Taro_037086 [Colocasia esculenta]|uniref:Uncharacterized protein n=1 Tax=Colocasia esculenta TaxID=4460 RepID=A0A843WA60_COLES|nr:hypothetical protein [Colocasia esculenta]
MMLRPTRLLRHHRDALGCRDKVTTARAVVIVSRQVGFSLSMYPAMWWSRRAGSTEFPTVVFSVPLVVSRFASALSFVGETSQQQQGVHREEETGR